MDKKAVSAFFDSKTQGTVPCVQKNQNPMDKPN